MTTSHAVQFAGPAGAPRVLAAKIGAVATAVAVGVALFGTYVGNSDSSQRSAGPALVGIAVAIGLVVFCGLAPQAIGAARAAGQNGQRWSAALAVASVLSLAVFWTGAPVILGAAAALSGSELPEATRTRQIARGVGLAVAALTIAWTILQSTVMS